MITDLAYRKNTETELSKITNHTELIWYGNGLVFLIIKSQKLPELKFSFPYHAHPSLAHTI